MVLPPKRRLGGGLDGLIPSGKPIPSQIQRPSLTAPIEEVHPNRSQPRSHFDDTALAELAQSIREMGVLEPILVRHRSQGGFEIIAGERRWRAAQRAGLREVPVFVRELSEKEAFEAAIVENLQREDLNPLETARAFQRLIDEHGHSQESIASRVGKDRTTITNVLRLLKLPEAVLERIGAGQLSEGHGRALLGAQDTKAILRLASEAVAKGWSVRETERRAREASGKATSGRTTNAKAEPSANIRDLELRLSRSLGVRVKIDDQGKKGVIHLPYSSLDELDRLLNDLLA
ncbi:MAG: ParB/RepB/Spo0J family partition protein [Sandaracinaceae bacterium]|nr:ParB/RepB/Spo0J family partition protein [Sandaracinaceae bacterium]